MTPTTLIMAYYENPGMLMQHFARLRALPDRLRDLLSVIIVDDGSPVHPAKAEDLNGIDLQIYRMRKDVRWNQDACRNIGVSHSEKDWVLLTDMDHIVPVETWEVVLLRKWDPNRVYQFRRRSLPDLEPYKHHPNTWFMARKKYDEAGGYDERFAGLYGTDADFRNRVAGYAEIIQMKADIIRVPRTVTPDASTTHYLRKQPQDSRGINRVKAERSKIEDWVPLRGTFEYDRVYP